MVRTEFKMNWTWTASSVQSSENCLNRTKSPVQGSGKEGAEPDWTELWHHYLGKLEVRTQRWPGQQEQKIKLGGFAFDTLRFKSAINAHCVRLINKYCVCRKPANLWEKVFNTIILHSTKKSLCVCRTWKEKQAERNGKARKKWCTRNFGN